MNRTAGRLHIYSLLLVMLFVSALNAAYAMPSENHAMKAAMHHDMVNSLQMDCETSASEAGWLSADSSGDSSSCGGGWCQATQCGSASVLLSATALTFPLFKEEVMSFHYLPLTRLQTDSLYRPPKYSSAV